MYNIEFKNQIFKVRELDMPEFGNVLISTTTLCDLLIDGNGNYLSEEAISVDEKLFFFVEENEINSDESELIETIMLAIQ